MTGRNLDLQSVTADGNVDLTATIGNIVTGGDVTGVGPYDAGGNITLTNLSVTGAYAQDLLDPALIHVVERWRDRAALAAHFAMPHLAQWRSQFAVLGITERNLELVEGEAEST